MRLQKQLNADISMGIDMQIKNNHYTGHIEGIPTFREGKVTRLNQWKEQNNINNSYIYFYADSANDLPFYAIKQMRLSPLTPMKD